MSPPFFSFGLVFGEVQGCSAEKRGVATRLLHQIKRKTAPNSSNKVSVRLQKFHCLWHWMMSQTVITQPCYCAILEINGHLFIYAPSGASSNVTSEKRCGNGFSPHYTPGEVSKIKVTFVTFCVKSFSCYMLHTARLMFKQSLEWHHRFCFCSL